MTKTVRFTFSISLIILLISLSFANVGTVLADEGTPTDVPTAEPTEPPVEETSEPVATPVPEETAIELLAQVPENTDVVVLDDGGETVTLASQAAADIVETGDPMWCPEGQAPTPGANGCTTNYGSITQLLAELTGSNLGNYQQDGIIYFAAGSSGGNFTLTAGNIGNGDFGNLNDYNLTLQGGWDPVTGTLSGQTNFGSSTISVGSSSNTWNGNITINNMTFNNVTGTSLTVFTSGDDIALNNVDVTYTTPATNQNNQYNVVPDTSSGNNDGNITIGAGSSFDNGTNGAGLYADADGGNITITGASGAPITFTDANGNGSGTNYNGATLAGEVVTLTNVTATNNDLNGIFIDNPDVVILNNVNASNNGTDPAGGGTGNAVGSGVNIDGGGGPDTVVVVNGGTFSDNKRYGVQVSNSSIIVQNAPTCSGNNFAASGTNNCFSEAAVTDTTAPNTSINSGPSGTVNSTGASFGFSGTDNLTPPNGLSFECRLDGAGFTTCSTPTTYSGLAAGSHTFQVRARDLAGNVDPSPASRTWTVDSIGPTITITLPAPNGSNGWFITSPVTGTVAATDNVMITDLTCSGSGVSQGTLNGDNTANATRSISIAGNGAHAITCTATDSANNTAQSTATVNIDTSVPNTSINSGPSGVVNTTSASFGFSGTDSPSGGLSFECNLDGAGFSACTSPASYSGLAASSHTFQVRAIDPAGNVDASPASRTWTIDLVAPTVTITLPAPNGSNGWFTSDPVTGTVSASDNISLSSLSCSGGFGFSQGGASGIGTTNASRSISISGMGMHNITCTASDGANSSQSTASVKIDTTAPIIIALGTSPDPNGAGWNNSDVTATWWCLDLGSGHSGSGSWFVSQTVTSEGANQSVTGTCQNDAGLTSSNTETGINIDKTAPVISGSRTPANANGWNNGSVVVSFTCSDALSGVNTNTVAGATVSAEGAGQSVTNTGTCRDRAGNTASPVTVNDINIDRTAPTASATAAPTPNGNGWNNTSVTVTFNGSDALSGIDFCDAPVVLSSQAAAQSASGTCTDRAGNISASATASNINIDTTAPTLNLPADLDVEATSTAGAAVTYSASATDNLDNSVVVTCSPAPGSTFPFGTTTVTCSSTDQADNTATGSFTVTVADTTAPVLSLPANIIEEAVGPTGNVVTFTATASDIVDGPVLVTCNPTSNSTFGLGTTTVNCFATDAANNTASGSFTITIRDTRPPKLTLPANITQEAVGPAGNVVTFTATSKDVVDGSVPVTCTPASGSTFGLGTTTVNCSATDQAGNTGTGSFTISIQDTTAPALSLPADITEEALGPAGNAVTFSATASDIVDGPLPVTCTPVSGSTFGITMTTVNCSAADGAGNTANGSFTVTVRDTTAPTLSLPADISEEAVGPAGNTVTFTATATDIVDGPLPVTCTPVSGSTFALGTTTVTCSVTDVAGNTATDTFTVTIGDTTAPALTLPADITEEAGGPAGNRVTFTASALDIVDGSVSVTCTPASGSTFAITTTTVTCSATDSAHNTATDSFTVTVQDTTAPVIASHADLFIKNSSEEGEEVHYGSPSTTDIVDGAGQATCTPASGSIFPLGHTVVTCTAIDAHGNVATSTTFKVHVFEAETPDQGGADLFIPLTGASNFTIACQAPDSFVVETADARIIFNNLCGYDALVEGLESASLPGKFPTGSSFLGGFTIDVLKDGKSVSPLPKDSSVLLEFDLAGDFDMKDYSALVWDGTSWDEVTGEKTADGYFRITLTDGGTFIIVEK